MNAITTDSKLSAALSERVDPLGLQWVALREAGAAIAMLAGGDIAAHAAPHLAFPRSLHSAPERRRMMIEQSIGDLVAMMEPGVAALLSVHERGGDAGPAARALWQEFVAARAALLALVPADDGAGQEAPE